MSHQNILLTNSHQNLLFCVLVNSYSNPSLFNEKNPQNTGHRHKCTTCSKTVPNNLLDSQPQW